MASSNKSHSLLLVGAAIVCVSLAVGCHRSVTEGEANRELTGRWVLNTELNCTYGAVESDELVLLPDGRMEQHLKLKDGQAFNSTTEHWSFMPKTNVSFDSRWNFPIDAKTPIKESESLIVEFGKTTVIVIDPDSNCFYQKQQ